jgi:hypothetical protein
VPTRPGTLVAFGLFGVVLAEVVLAGVAAWPAGMTIVEAVDGFLVTNIAIGVSCGTAGVLVAWQRARYPLGWLLLAAGVFQTATAAAAPLIVLGVRRGWPEPTLRSIDTVFAYAWPCGPGQPLAGLGADLSGRGEQVGQVIDCPAQSAAAASGVRVPPPARGQLGRLGLGPAQRSSWAPRRACPPR